MAEAKNSESARTTVILALATVLVGFYVLFFGLQALIFFEAHHWASASPYLRVVPQALPSATASPAQEKSLDLYGFEFDAPWKDVAKKTEGTQTSQVEFKSGAIVLFFNPDGEKDIVGDLRSGNEQTFNTYQTVFGAGAFADNYDLYAAVYGASPSQIHLLGSRSYDVRESTLLLWKLAFGTGGKNTMYNIQSGDWRGFQFGDTSRNPSVLVQLFDSHDKQLRLLITAKNGASGTISQADVDCVVDSLRPQSFGK